MAEILEEHEHTTLISTAAMLVQAIESYGLDADAFLGELGVGLDDYTDPDGRIPVSIMQRAWALAVKWSGDPCFGLSLAQVLQPAALHGLGLSMTASDSLKDAFRRVARYQQMVSTILNVEMEEAAEGYLLRIGTQNYRNTPMPASVDATMAIVMQMCRVIGGPTITPRRVTFAHAAPDCRNRFSEFFDCPVSFSRQLNSLLFDRETFERKLPTAHPALARANDRVVIDYLEEFERQTLETKVRAQIIERLPDGTPNEGVIARKLNMSLRNMQRQLKSEGTGYKQILDETRKSLAVRYLDDHKLQIIEISYLLGFSEQSNFSRAFKRWTGSTPRQHRVDSEPVLQPKYGGANSDRN